MEIELWDGTIVEDVPDGLSRSEIRMGLLKRGINPDPPPERVDPTEGMSNSQRFAAGVGKSVVDTGRGLKQLFNLEGPKTVSDLVSGDSPQERLKRTIADERELSQPLLNTGAGMAGEVTGQVGQFLAPGGLLLRGAKGAQKLAAILRNPYTRGAAQGVAQVGGAARAMSQALLTPKTYKAAAAGGAAFGATQPSLSDAETMTNVGFGALGGVGGQLATRAIGAAVQPIVGAASSTTRALAQALEDRGVKLSAAQIKDSRPLKFLESAFASLPFTAGREAQRVLTQNQQFTRAALKAAGEDAGEATPQVLNQAHERLGKTFQVLSNLPKVKLGDDMLNRLASLDTVQAELRGVLDTAPIDNLVKGMLDKLSRGELSGSAAQTIRSELTKEAKAAAASNPRLSTAIKEVRDGVDSAIRDQLTPAQREAWDLAREQYTALKTIERSMSKTTETASRGFVSPAALGEAVRSGDKARFPRATGELATLARAGSGVIKPPPTSGTAEREMMVRLLTGGGLTGAGTGASLATGDPTYAALGATSLFAPKIAQTAFYSPTVQKYLAHGAGRVSKDALLKVMKAPLPKSVAPKIERLIDSSLPDAAKRRLIASALRSAAATTPAAAATEPKRR